WPSFEHPDRFGVRPGRRLLVIERGHAGCEEPGLLTCRGAFVHAFAGDDRQLHTSILGHLCASLCDAVTGKADGLDRLEEIQGANLFWCRSISAVTGTGITHLFRDLLRHDLARAEPGLGPKLHRRACTWHRAKGEVDGAVFVAHNGLD